MKTLLKGIYYNRHESENYKLGLTFLAGSDFMFGGFNLFYPLWILKKRIYLFSHDYGLGYYYGSFIFCFRFRLWILNRKQHLKWYQLIVLRFYFTKFPFGEQFFIYEEDISRSS